MDLMEKKMRWDIKTLAGNPLMFYGKVTLLVLGAFLLGRMSK